MHTIKRPLAAVGAVLAVAGGALAYTQTADAATNLSVTLSASGTGSSASWNSTGDPVLTVGSASGSNAKITVNTPATAVPVGSPTFTTSAQGNSPHWVVTFSGGDSLVGPNSGGTSGWAINVPSGGCAVTPAPPKTDTYANQKALLDKAGCDASVTSAVIVADTAGSSTISAIQYGTLTLPAGADVVTVTSPGTQTSAVGTAISSLQIVASSSKGDGIASYAASNLPPGLAIDTAKGAITGTPTTAGSFAVTVSATDNGGTKGSMNFVWNVGTGVHTTFSGTIKLVRMGLCLDDQLNSHSNGAIVQVWRCNGSANQNWQVMSDGTIQHNGLCLDARGLGTTDRTRVQLWACTGKGNQKWDTSGWRVHYDNPAADNKVLDDTGFGKSGTQQEIYTNNGGANQTWGTS